MILILWALTAAVPRPAAAAPGPSRPSRPHGVNLFASALGIVNGNRVFCLIDNVGDVCTGGQTSFIGGGFWPKGSSDEYIFNSGLEIAGVIPADGRFAWSGDTVGAWFMDPRGDQEDGAPITPVFNSLDPADLAAWPEGAVVRDTAIYSGVIQDRKTVSQQDLWLRTWEGVPNRSDGARSHPMGLLVEERALVWNYPVGAEDLVYFVYTFYNVTARNPAVYDGLDPAIRGEIASIGQDFQTRNEAAYGIEIPDDGYSITAAYAAFVADMDVGDPGSNYATPVIPFDMGVAYNSRFYEPSWFFPPDIFGPPFVPAPGFVGVKYLRSPFDSAGRPIGLTIFSDLLNQITFPDAVGVKQLYRYLSGTSSPETGDGRCTYQGEQRKRHICFLGDFPADVRFFQSSGPLTLAPGQRESIVVAYIFAAATDVVTPFVNGDFNPGQHPATGADLARDSSLVRPIERAMGWVTQRDANGDTVISQDEVRTVPRSLLHKAQVAQAVYDSKFLLPFAPDPPNFFLIPGDNQVTVVWEKSPSEVVRPHGGDPFFAVASDPTALLYDPNFRQYDVEGYRIYRGRSTGDLRLIAQFDYAGTTITDYTGAFAYTEDLDGDGIVRCAPELGLQQDCPTRFATQPPFLNGHANALVGPVIQVPPGGRVALADSSVLIISADTAVTGGGFPALTDGGVPFSFIDRGARNAFDYYYAVTAFDLNSLRSGPSSIESTRVAKLVTPRASSGQEVSGHVSGVELIGSDGAVPRGSDPTLNATTGRFSGPSAPTDGINLGLVTFLPELLSDTRSLSLTIDSITPGAALNGIAAIYYVTARDSGTATALTIPVPVNPYGSTSGASITFPAAHVSQAQASRFDRSADSSFMLFGSTAITIPGTWRLTSWGRASFNGDPASSDFNGPRWFVGSNETQDDPNGSHCRGSPGACVAVVGSGAIDTAFPGLTHTAGALPGVDTIFHILSYNTVPAEPQRQLEGITATVTRAADIAVYWGAAGRIDSVIDRTHHVPVPFRPAIGASWGILNDSSFLLGGTNPATTADGKNDLLTWMDDFCVAPSPRLTGQCGGAAQRPALLMDHARLSSIATHAATPAGTADLVAGGNGFTLYLNGHFFLMQLATLPAAGTVWTCRFYAGSIIGTPRHYAFLPAVRPPAVPGLRARITYSGSVFDPTRTTAANLARVHTVPDPYYVTSALETSSSFKVLKFVNLPAQAIVRIYSLSGVLIAVLTHNDPAGGGELAWDLRTRNNQFVASGVYFYHVETPDRRSTVGRFTVVSFAP